MSLRPYLLLAGAALLFNLGLSLSSFYDWNYDSWNHLFFASHYMNFWFDTWEPRWFGGFSVTSYPPSGCSNAGATVICRRSGACLCFIEPGRDDSYTNSCLKLLPKLSLASAGHLGRVSLNIIALYISN